jgi:hypothetical protein
MGKPLNIESKIFGFLKISNLYFLISSCLVILFFLSLFENQIGFGMCFVILIVLLSVEVSYFFVANSLPENFIFHWVKFKLSPKYFYPKKQSIKRRK